MTLEAFARLANMAKLQATDMSHSTNLDRPTPNAQGPAAVTPSPAARERRAVLAACSFALLVMVLMPPFDGPFGVEYASIFEPRAYVSGASDEPGSFEAWLDPSRPRKRRMTTDQGPTDAVEVPQPAPITWGRVATRVVWLTIAAGLGYAAAPMIAGRSRRGV